MGTVATVMLAVLLAAGAVEAQPFDHLACSKVKDPAPRAAYTVGLDPSDPGVPAAAGCIVKVPAKLLCVDVRKTDVAPPPPGAPAGAPAQRYLCYKTKCPRQELTLPATDQFGSRAVAVRNTNLVCAPLVATTTTSTTTTTTLPADVRCCSLGSSCFDAAEAFASGLCNGIGGSLGAVGESCDGTTGACTATGAQGPLCCQCTAAGGFCMEGPIVPFGDLCFQLGCTPIVGQTCDVVTHSCHAP